MNLSSCITTSDRRLRSWKMVMFFLRICTWQWYKMESSTKKSEREGPRCIFLLRSLCTVLTILACMVEIKACVKFAMRLRNRVRARPSSLRNSLANLTPFSAYISHSPEYHAGCHCFECLKQKKRKKEGDPCLMLQTSTITYTITTLLCWSYHWNWIKSDSYLTVVNILVYLDSWTRRVFVCSRTGKRVVHLTSPFTHLKTRLLL